MLRSYLRDATSACHARVDAVASRFDLTTPEGYAGLLAAHAAVLPAIEQRLDAGPCPPDWGDRRRSAALLADMAALQAPVPQCVAVPDFTTPAMRLGAMYVIEGSRLGNELIRRNILAHWPQAPTRFLAHGAGEKLWPRFVAWLDAPDHGSLDRDEAVAGATSVFATYERAFQRDAPVAVAR